MASSSSLALELLRKHRKGTKLVAGTSPLEELVENIDAETARQNGRVRTDRRILQAVSREANDLATYIALFSRHTMNKGRKKGKFEVQHLHGIVDETVLKEQPMISTVTPATIKLLRNRYFNNEPASIAFSKRMYGFLYASIKRTLARISDKKKVENRLGVIPSFHVKRSLRSRSSPRSRSSRSSPRSLRSRSSPRSLRSLRSRSSPRSQSKTRSKTPTPL